ncbi:unnamed protein product [Camellia sinensis]
MLDCKCAFEAIFNFGDSNSDTGGFWAAFPAQSGPYGMTYFKKPAGRATDGRLMIDFLAHICNQSDQITDMGPTTLASTIPLPKSSLFVSGLSPFALAIQLNQMKHFKVKVDEPQSNGSNNLPQTDVFGKSIFTFYIGQNDFTSDLGSLGMSGPKIMLSQVVSQITATIKDGRIWKEQVSAGTGVRRRADLPVMQEGTRMESESMGPKPWRPSNRMILPSINAPEHNILQLLKECNASGIRSHMLPVHNWKFLLS